MYALLLFALQVVTYPPPVALQGADVRSANVTLDSSGNATWSFSPSFDGIPDITHLPINTDTVNAVICNATERTVNYVKVHCYKTNTLGLLSGILGGSVNGLQVNLIARYKAP